MVSTEEFRRVMGSFATGVTVVTTAAQDGLSALTVNAFCSVSLEPLLVLICVERTADTHRLLRQGGVFAVNVLHEGQEEVSRLFANKGTAKQLALQDLPHRVAVTGAPVLADALAYLDCRVVEAIEAGDHTVFIGRVEEAAVHPGGGAPLIFYRGAYHTLRTHPR